MKKQKEMKPRKISKVFAKTTDHYMEHMHWDFSPEMPQPGKIVELLKKAKTRIEDVSTESICGSMDDMQHVEQYDGTLGVTQAFVAAHERPVGQLQWNNNLGTIYTNPGNVNGERWCSGTLIANDLFISAGHCFDVNPNGWQTPRDNATGLSVQPAQLAMNMHVNFNFQVDPMGNLRAEQSFPVTQLVEFRLGGLDFAIARLGGNPGATFGVAVISNVDANDGDMLCVIQHPSGLPKRIEAGPQFHLHDDRLGYDTLDTLGGSSGSGILRESTGMLVGVHTNGGCTSSGAGHNHGMRIISIINNSPTIRGILAPKFKFVDDPIKRKFSDDPKFKFVDDPIFTTFRHDPKLKFIDDPITRKFSDDPKFKFTDDPIGTFKAVDDVKAIGRDKLLSDKIDPGSWYINPAVAGAQPFVLSTPHHSSEWQQQYPGGVASSSEMQQLEKEIEKVHSQLQQLYEQCGEVEKYYQQLTEAYNASSGTQ